MDAAEWTISHGSSPEHPGMLMRDPFLRARQGRHLASYSGRGVGLARKRAANLKIGYSTSKDLIDVVAAGGNPDLAERADGAKCVGSGGRMG